MIVIDASALIEMLLVTGVGMRVRARLSREEDTLHAPHLLDLEIVQVLRRGCLIGDLQPHRAAEALADLGGLRIVRHPHEPHVPRIWATAPQSHGLRRGVCGARRSSRSAADHARWPHGFRPRAPRQNRAG